MPHRVEADPVLGLSGPATREEILAVWRREISACLPGSDRRRQIDSARNRAYAVFARRPCLDTEYYETFNLPNVHLKNCLKDPIVEITVNGIHTEAGEVELDMIIFATGYDALTGALMAFRVEDKDGRTINEKWAGGAQSYLGLMVEGFPNMFLTCSPNGPAALANIITISEHDVDWISDLVTHMDRAGQISAEATSAGEERWMNVVTSLAATSLVRLAKTWWVGANVEGKSQGLTMFIGGFNKYAEACAAAKAGGYAELSFEAAHEDART